MLNSKAWKQNEQCYQEKKKDSDKQTVLKNEHVKEEK